MQVQNKILSAYRNKTWIEALAVVPTSSVTRIQHGSHNMKRLLLLQKTWSTPVLHHFHYFEIIFLQWRHCLLMQPSLRLTQCPQQRVLRTFIYWHNTHSYELFLLQTAGQTILFTASEDKVKPRSDVMNIVNLTVLDFRVKLNSAF